MSSGFSLRKEEPNPQTVWFLHPDPHRPCRGGRKVGCLQELQKELLAEGGENLTQPHEKVTILTDKVKLSQGLYT